MKHALFGLAATAALMATPAMAADMMPFKAPPPPMWSWSGCYVGGNVGGGGTTQNQNRVDTIPVGGGAVTAAPAAYGSEGDSGIIGGGQVGCDYQFGSAWVIGLQGQFDWGNLNGSHALPAFPTFTMYDKTNNFDTAAVRLGYAFAPSVLAYVKGGGAWVHNSDVLLQPSGAL